MAAGRNGPSGPPAGRSARTGAAVSARLRPLGTVGSTAAAA